MNALDTSPSPYRRTGGKSGFVEAQLKATHPDEAEIIALKRHLETLNARRQQACIEIERRNAALIDRDEIASQRFKAMLQTEIDEAEQTRQEQSKKHKSDREALEAEEETMRALLIEEDSLERALLLNFDHMSLITITVSRIHADTRRRQREVEARAEAISNAKRMQAKVEASFLSSVMDSRQALVKTEANDWKSVTARFNAQMEEVRKRAVTEEAAAAARQAQNLIEAEALRQQQAEDEVAELEAAFERRATACLLRHAAVGILPSTPPNA